MRPRVNEIMTLLNETDKVASGKRAVCFGLICSDCKFTLNNTDTCIFTTNRETYTVTTPHFESSKISNKLYR